MSVLEIDINRETRRAQIFRARLHAAIGDHAPLEDIPTDDLTNAHHRLQTRTRQGDPQGWAWVHATLVEAELRRRHKPPTNRPVDIVPTPCGNDENEAPNGKIGGAAPDGDVTNENGPGRCARTHRESQGLATDSIGEPR